MPSDSRPTVLITGAGSGLGAAMARRFASEGYRVAVCDVDEARAAEVLADIRDSAPGSFCQRMDVRETPDWDATCQRVLTEWGGLNVLVNNAGVAAAGNCEDTPLEDWRWVIDIDLMGVVYGCHRFIPLLRDAAATPGAACHLVNVASFAGIAAMPGMCAYGVAKAGVIALSEQLRAELHDAGVGVSVVCPAFVQTRIAESLRSTDAALRSRIEKWMKQSGISAEEVAEQTLNAVRSGRFMVLTHPVTRKAWLMKRWLPERYFRAIISRTRPRKNQQEHAKAS